MQKTEVAKVSPTVASVTSSVVITATTATISGTVSDDGGDPIIARGVVYGLNPNPTISDSKTSDGTGTGNFTSSITGLLPGTTYYLRAYATNSAGTVYGNEIVVITLSQDVKNIVPDNILTVMTNLGMPIYTGKTPPNLVNFYKLSPRTLKNSNVPNDYCAGTVFYDMNIHFYNQDNTALSLKMDFAEMGSGGRYGNR